MVWMHDTQARRRQPAALWPAVRSIVVVAMNYGPDADPLAGLADRTRPNVSVYARNRDYHDVIKGRLKLLGGWLAAQNDARGAALKVFVDTAPVMEKPLAQAAGLGWQGKHTNLVARGFGSWLFLGSIFTDLDLAPDTPEADHCGSCRACLDACPTGAFPAPYQLDARRCISYLTIEHAGHIPAAFRRAIGNRVYGCDDCLAVCPWNRFAQMAREAKLQGRPDLAAPPPLADWLALDEAGFRALFAGSPIKRLGFTRFCRNLLIASGNSGERGLVDVVAAHLDAASPLRRAAAVWALGRLCTPAALRALAARHAPCEDDADVNAEWTALAGLDLEMVAG